MYGNIIKHLIKCSSNKTNRPIQKQSVGVKYVLMLTYCARQNEQQPPKIYELLLTASLLRLDLIASLVGRGPDQDEVLFSPECRLTPRRFIQRGGISQHLAHRLRLFFFLFFFYANKPICQVIYNRLHQ